MLALCQRLWRGARDSTCLERQTEQALSSAMGLLGGGRNPGQVWLCLGPPLILSEARLPAGPNGFLTRYERELREPLVWRQGSQVPMRWLGSLGGEDPLEKEMAAHSSSLAWEIPWTEEPSRLQPIGSQTVRHN